MNSCWVHHSQFSPHDYRENIHAFAKLAPACAVNECDFNTLRLRTSNHNLVEAAIETDGNIETIIPTDNLAQLRRSQEQEIDRFTPQETSNVIYVLGCDLGYSLEMVSSYLARAPRKAAVVVEPDERLLHLTLASRSLAPWLQSNRIDWAVGRKWEHVLRSLIWDHNYFTCSQPDILFSLTARRPERIASWSKMQAVIRQQTADCRKRFQTLLTEAEAFYAQRKTISIQRLLAPSTANDPAKAVPYIQERFLDECRNNQIEVIYHEPGFRSDIRLLKQIADERPDAMMMINRSPAEFARREQLDRLRMPRFIWCIDDPNCFLDGAFGEHDFVFTWDNAYADDLKGKSAQSVDFFPYVADMDKATANYNERFASPVSYIGQVKCLNPIELHLNPAEAALVEKAGKMKAQQRERSYQTLLLELQSEFGLHVLDSELDEAPRLLRYAMYIVANAHWRIAVLERARVFGLKIYGNDDWKIYLKDHPLLDCFCGPADPERDVPDIFYSSKINLNIHSLQALTSLNQRDYNCPLVGGFILTDWVIGADDFFDPNTEMAFYHNLDELEAKISHFLNHNDKRQEIIQMGRARVMRDHLYSVRVPRALETFKQRIQERYGASIHE